MLWFPIILQGISQWCICKRNLTLAFFYQFSSVAWSCLTLCNPMNRIIHGVAMMIKGRNLGGHDLETRAHSEGKALATES